MEGAGQKSGVRLEREARLLAAALLAAPPCLHSLPRSGSQPSTSLLPDLPPASLLRHHDVKSLLGSMDTGGLSIYTSNLHCLLPFLPLPLACPPRSLLGSMDTGGLSNYMATISRDGRWVAAGTFTSDVKARPGGVAPPAAAGRPAGPSPLSACRPATPGRFAAGLACSDPCIDPYHPAAPRLPACRCTRCSLTGWAPSPASSWPWR